MLRSIEALSDDDGGGPDDAGQVVAGNPAAGAVVPHAHPPKRKRSAMTSTDSIVEDSRLRQRLRQIVSSSCYCYKKSRKRRQASNCFVAFRDQLAFDQVLCLRRELKK